MNIESITFNTAESKITVSYQDGTSKDYIDSVTYCLDHPDRVSDVVAMGWTVPESMLAAMQDEPHAL